MTSGQPRTAWPFWLRSLSPAEAMAERLVLLSAAQMQSQSQCRTSPFDRCVSANARISTLEDIASSALLQTGPVRNVSIRSAKWDQGLVAWWFVNRIAIAHSLNALTIVVFEASVRTKANNHSGSISIRLWRSVCGLHCDRQAAQIRPSR